MSNVLLINPSYQPHWSLYEPTGLLTLASSLQKQGFGVKILDLNLYHKDQVKDILTLSKIEEFSHIGISAITRQALEAYRIGNIIRNEWPEKTLTYGGVHPTFLPEEPFEKGKADFVIQGAGEISYPQLLHHIENKNSLYDIPGVLFKHEGDIVHGKKIELLKNLDTLPSPDYSLIDIGDYNTNIHVPGYIGRTINMMTSRGCTESCYYCSSPALYNRTVQFRSADSIITEIESLLHTYGVKYIHFADDNFLLDKKRLIQICNSIIDKNLDFQRICLSRVESVLENEENLDLLRKAGCVGMEIGVESGDTKVFTENNKNNKTLQIIKANSLLKENKIFPMYLLMSYALGETINSSRKTIELYYQLEGNSDITNLPIEEQTIKANLAGHLARVSPGSVFHTIAPKKGILLAEDWDQHCEEELGFLPNTFLNDIPQIKKQVSQNDFFQYIESYRTNIHLYANQNFYLSNPILQKYFNNDFTVLTSFMYDTFCCIDGKKTVRDLASNTIGDIKTGLTKVAVVISMLSVFGFISGGEPE